MKVNIHKTAIVDDGAIIGIGTSVWHWSHISSKAKIGENCKIGQNIFIGNNVIIGNNCKIQNNVSIFEGVEIGDNVFCGPSMVFTNVLNPRSEINRKDEFQKTIIENGVTLGANSTIVCGIKIREYAFVGAGAVVLEDVKPFALIVGVPGKQIGWMSKDGKRLNLPISGFGKAICSYSGLSYRLVNDECLLEGV